MQNQTSNRKNRTTKKMRRAIGRIALAGALAFAVGGPATVQAAETTNGSIIEIDGKRYVVKLVPLEQSTRTSEQRAKTQARTRRVAAMDSLTCAFAPSPACNPDR